MTGVTKNEHSRRKESDLRKLEQLEAELEEKIESLKVVTQTSDALNMENKSEIDNQQKNGGGTAPQDHEANQKNGGETAPQDHEANQKNGGGTAPQDHEANQKNGGETAPQDHEAYQKNGGGTAPHDDEANQKNGGDHSKEQDGEQANGSSPTVAEETEDKEGSDTESTDAEIQSTRQEYSESKSRKPQQVECALLTDEERRIIVETWELIQDRVSAVGVSAYNELFRLSPQAVQFFPMLVGVDPSDDEQFRQIIQDHSIRILGIVGLIVRDLSKIKGTAKHKDYHSLYKFSFQLGEKHFRYGANPRLMGLLGLSFAQAMKNTLLEMDNYYEVEEAWKSFFSVVTSWMRRGFLYVQNKGKEPNEYKIPLAEILQVEK